MLMCDETIALVHYEADQDDDRYTCTEIHGASWYGKTKITLQDHGLVEAKEVRVRIPADHLPSDTLMKKGDYLVRGTLDKEITKPADLQGYEYCEVMEIRDNQRGGLPHWAVTGK